MSNPTIQAELRTSSGKGAARKLRRANRIPAVAYGGSGQAISISIDPQDLTSLRQGDLGWNQPVQINVEGGESVDLALLQAVDRHPISGAFLHADFRRLDANAEISVKVPLVLEGSAPGVAVGGLLNQQVRALAVRCQPKDIPAGIAVDISKLEVGDRLMLSELKLPAGVVSSVDETSVVSVAGRRGAREDELLEGDGDEAEAGAEGADAEGGEGSAEGAGEESGS